jgi:hypothetical protein
MSTVETVKETVAGKVDELRKDPSFVELEKFYVAMKDQGLVRKQEYSLPLIDTIGHSTLSSRSVSPIREKR